MPPFSTSIFGMDEYFTHHFATPSPLDVQADRNLCRNLGRNLGTFGPHSCCMPPFSASIFGMDEYFTHHFVTPFIRTQKMCPVTLPSPFPHFLRVTKEQELWHFSGTSCLAAPCRTVGYTVIKMKLQFLKILPLS